MPSHSGGAFGRRTHDATRGRDDSASFFFFFFFFFFFVIRYICWAGGISMSNTRA